MKLATAIPAALLALTATAATAHAGGAESAPDAAATRSSTRVPVTAGLATYLGVNVASAGDEHGAALIEAQLGRRIVGPLFARARAGYGRVGDGFSTNGTANEQLAGLEVRGCVAGFCAFAGVDAGVYAVTSRYSTYDGGLQSESSTRSVAVEPRLGLELGGRHVAFRGAVGARTSFPFASDEERASRATVELGVVVRF